MILSQIIITRPHFAAKIIDLDDSHLFYYENKPIVVATTHYIYFCSEYMQYDFLNFHNKIYRSFEESFADLQLWHSKLNLMKVFL